MRWSTVRELFKVNLLYSDPQSVVKLRNKQKQKPKESFSVYKELLWQQGLLTVFFTFFNFIYITRLNFTDLDFISLPSLFSFHLALYGLMAFAISFSTMYAVFYQSNDVKLYAHLPVKAGELFLAKILASLGLSLMPLMTILLIFVLAYWQLLTPPLALLVAAVNFAVIFISCIVLSLVINSFIGRRIARSRLKKLNFTILMSLTAFVSLGLVFYLFIVNQQPLLDSSGNLTRVSDPYFIYPYFRGFYDVVQNPFSSASLLHYWLPLLAVFFLLIYLVWKVIPRYFEDSLYQNQEQISKKNKPFKDLSSRQLLIRHHLMTIIQNAALLINSFLLPLLFFLLFLIPYMIGRAFLSADYIGIAMLAGLIVGISCVMPTSVLAVGMSLEKENFPFFKALPLKFSDFIRQKFLVLWAVQVSVPLLFFLLFLFFLPRISFFIAFFFVLGFLLATFIQGQFMYRRDYNNLLLNWQDISQLFQRKHGRYLVFGLAFLDFFIGLLLMLIMTALSLTFRPLAVSLFTIILILLLAGLLQYHLIRTFWRKLSN
ncbi:ABC transporter permease [Streptococcus sp. H49]|uniref:ABC transporter permease n=1 Tax=Streptococcus huangxiaojuni TaxID=3237239 RepID=UPI0034A3C743